MKQCSKCKKTKSLVKFSKNQHHCKECNKKYRKKNIDRIIQFDWAQYYIHNIENYKGRNKKYRQSSKGKAFYKKFTKKYAAQFPEKIKANNLWYSFKAKYDILIPANYIAHHWSYNHPLDVIFMPDKIHREIHRKMKYDQPHQCFKAVDGILLDTKEKHIHYVMPLLNLRR